MKFKVDIIESERDWGQKLVRTETFESADEAWTFVDDFNKRNISEEKEVPDWYMVAEDPRRVS